MVLDLTKHSKLQQAVVPNFEISVVERPAGKTELAAYKTAVLDGTAVEIDMPAFMRSLDDPI